MTISITHSTLIFYFSPTLTVRVTSVDGSGGQRSNWDMESSDRGLDVDQMVARKDMKILKSVQSKYELLWDLGE